jgi:hypothetical protein
MMIIIERGGEQLSKAVEGWAKQQAKTPAPLLVSRLCEEDDDGVEVGWLGLSSSRKRRRPAAERVEEDDGKQPTNQPTIRLDQQQRWMVTINIYFYFIAGSSSSAVTLCSTHPAHQPFCCSKHQSRHRQLGTSRVTLKELGFFDLGFIGMKIR